MTTSDVEQWSYNLPGEISMARGEGVFLYDDEGRRYLDLAAGTFNLSLGYSHPEVVAAVRDQAAKLVHASSAFANEPVARLTEMLGRLLPAPLSKVHLKVTGGSTANEGAIKMAQRATGRRDVVSFFGSHHGQTLQTAAVSGNAFRRAPFASLPDAGVVVPGANCRRCFYEASPASCRMLCVRRIDDFVEYASSGGVACVIVEPITGNGGNVVPPDGYLGALRDFCAERGIVLVFDEVQTGIGRTGEMFAAQTFGVVPDVITLGKGLSGIGMPIGAICTTPALQGLEASQHAFTGGSNALSAVAACTTLEIMQRPGFLEHVRAMGELFMARLRRLPESFEFVGDVRGRGLMIGVEVVGHHGEPDVERTNAVAREALRLGLVVRTSRFGRGNVLKVRPPLVIAADEVDEACDLLEKALDATRP